MTAKRRNEPLPRYIERLLECGWTPAPGEVVSVAVLHHDDCASRRGVACDCEPILQIRRNLSAEEIRAELVRQR